MCREEEKEMAIASKNIKEQLEELRQRALKRKEKFTAKPSEKYLKELEENAELLYEAQMQAMELPKKWK